MDPHDLSRRLRDAEARVRELDEELQRTRSELRRLSLWVEMLWLDFQAVVGSRSWRLARALGRGLRGRLAGRGASPGAPERAARIGRRYARWRRERLASGVELPPCSGPTHDEHGGRIAHVGLCVAWHDRGITFQARQLADAIECGRLRTHVFARGGSLGFRNEPPIDHPRLHAGGEAPAPDEVLRWAQSARLDLVIWMEVWPGDWERIAALRRAGIRVMLYENLDLLRWASVPAYGRTDFFLCNTHYTREVLGQLFPHVPALLLPWGFDPDPPRSAPPRGPGPLRFLHVAGRIGLDDRKNTRLVVRAFERLRGDAVLHLHCQESLAALGGAVERSARENPRIVLHSGTLGDIREAYASADVLLAVSKREGLGMPIVEALASGLPVLTLDGYTMKQWIVPGEHGVLCAARPIYRSEILPQMEAREADLVDALERLAGDREQVEALRAAVRRDAFLWSWSWQGKVLREELLRIAEDPAYRPSPDLSYLPAALLEFEARRRAAFHGSGEMLDARLLARCRSLRRKLEGSPR